MVWWECGRVNESLVCLEIGNASKCLEIDGLENLMRMLFGVYFG